MYISIAKISSSLSDGQQCTRTSVCVGGGGGGEVETAAKVRYGKNLCVLLELGIYPIEIQNFPEGHANSKGVRQPIIWPIYAAIMQLGQVQLGNCNQIIGHVADQNCLATFYMLSVGGGTSPQDFS